MQYLLKINSVCLRIFRQHCLALLDDMEAQQDAQQECRVQVDTRSISTTMSACAKGGDWHRALKLFIHMQHMAIHPDRHCHTVLLNSFQRGRAWQLGLEHVEHIFKHGAWHADAFDAISYDTALSLCEAGAWQEAFVLLGRMQVQQLQPSIAGLFSIVKAIQNGTDGTDGQQGLQDQTFPNFDRRSTLQDLYQEIQRRAILLLREIEERHLSGKRNSRVVNSQVVHVVRALDIDDIDVTNLTVGEEREELKKVFREVVLAPVLKFLRMAMDPNIAAAAISESPFIEIHGLGVDFTREAPSLLSKSYEGT